MRVLLCMATVLVSACVAPTDGSHFAGVPSLVLLDSVVAAPGNVRFELRNNTRRSFEHGACATIVERRAENGQWVRAEEAHPTARACIAIGYTLSPERTLAGAARILETAQPGMHRVLFQLGPGWNPITVASRPFRIE